VLVVGYGGLAPRIKQSGERSRSGERSKAGSRTLRFAAVEATQGAWRETNPWHRLYSDVQGPHRQGEPGQERRRPQGPDRLLARAQRPTPFKPSRPRNDPVPASSSCFLAA
jgi:hypothetical protein